MSLIHTLPLETQTVVVTRFISDVCEHRKVIAGWLRDPFWA